LISCADYEVHRINDPILKKSNNKVSIHLLSKLQSAGIKTLINLHVM